MKKIISYGKQHIDKEDIKFTSNAFRQNLITTGKFVFTFEKKLKDKLSVKHAISCNSGTSALYLAFKSIDLFKGDVVIMPAINFIASYNICRMFEAKIYLADIDRKTGQMTPDSLKQCIKLNKLKKIKVILTMYMGGYPENIIEFNRLRKKHNSYLIEDACHAFGAKYQHKSKLYNIGSCKHSDICTFSFHPLKTITTGEGGLVTTNSKKISNKIKLLRSHGLERKNKHWIYDIQNPGLNFRLSDINCALGISQLKKIEKFINKRKKIYKIYLNKLRKFGKFITFPKYSINNKSAYHLFIIQINFDLLKTKKDRFFEYMKNNNIICQYHYIPIYKFAYFKAKKNYNLKNCENYFKKSLSLPIYYELNLKEIDKIIKKISQFIKLNIK